MAIVFEEKVVRYEFRSAPEESVFVVNQKTIDDGPMTTLAEQEVIKNLDLGDPDVPAWLKTLDNDVRAEWTIQNP